MYFLIPEILYLGSIPTFHTGDKFSPDGKYNETPSWGLRGPEGGGVWILSWWKRMGQIRLQNPEPRVKETALWDVNLTIHTHTS